ncbi:hypothetical protein [Sphingomonas montanisoli]|uniref:Uncharacterized protein n=1 Tax=Sphingomonas montanisoli TaxID=2606412 RepID=A0A5D9C355_9SPHN|nr:hypothetical protein [Sphingomonas montanisoli]TZG25893.1 hypothetical protein FYJ91_13010 [Sphingomonas montanisoli]
MTAFLNVPDKFAGYPVGIADAIDQSCAWHLGADWRLTMASIDEAVIWSRQYERALSYALATGELAAYVQISSSEKYYQIPKDVWRAFTKEDANLPRTLPDFSTIPGYDARMAGCPILIWADALERWSSALSFRLGQLVTPVRVEVSEEERASPAKSSPVSAEGQDISSQATTFNRYSNWQEHGAWYTDRVSSAPPEGFTRKQDEEAGRLVGISRDRIRDLRGELAPEHWKKDGPKLKPNLAR